MRAHLWLSLILGILLSGIVRGAGFAEIPDPNLAPESLPKLKTPSYPSTPPGWTNIDYPSDAVLKSNEWKQFNALDQQFFALRQKFPAFRVQTDQDMVELAKVDSELESKQAVQPSQLGFLPGEQNHYFSLLQEMRLYLFMIRDSQIQTGLQNLPQHERDELANDTYVGPSLERLKIWYEQFSQQKLPSDFDYKETKKNYHRLLQLQKSVGSRLELSDSQKYWFRNLVEYLGSVPAVTKLLLPITAEDKERKSKIDQETLELLGSLKPFAWFHVMASEERKKLEALAEKVSQKTGNSDPFLSSDEINQRYVYNQISLYIQGKLQTQDNLGHSVSGKTLESLKRLPSGEEMSALVKPFEQDLPLSAEAFQKLKKARETLLALGSAGDAIGPEFAQLRSMLEKAVVKQKELTTSEADRKTLENQLAELQSKIDASDRASEQLRLLSENEIQSLKDELKSIQAKTDTLKKDEPLLPAQSQVLAALRLYAEKLKTRSELQTDLDQPTLDSVGKMLKSYAEIEPIQKRVLEEGSLLTESERTQLTDWSEKYDHFTTALGYPHHTLLVQKLKRVVQDVKLSLSFGTSKSLTQYDQFSELPSDDCMAALGSEEQKQIQEFQSALTELMKMNQTSDPCCTPSLAKITAPKLKKLSAKALRGYLTMLNSSDYFFSKRERQKWLEQPKDSAISQSLTRKLALYPSYDPSSGLFESNCPECSAGGQTGSSVSSGYFFNFPEPSQKTLEDVRVFCQEADQLAKNDPEVVAKLVSARLSSAADHPCPENGALLPSQEEVPRYGIQVSDEILDAFHELMPQLGIYAAQGKQLQATLESKGLGHLGLTPEELLAIRAYAGSTYGPVNRAMYEKDQLALKKYRPFIEVMASGLRKMPAYKGLVRRGATLPKSVLDQHQVGSIVSYDSFTSTSVRKGFHVGSDGTRILIYSKTCRYVAPVAYEGEQEAICLPGTKFKVLYNQDHHLILREVASP